MSPVQARCPFMVEKSPPVCLLALSPPGLLPKPFSVSRPTIPAGIERKFLVLNGAPVISVVTGFPLFLYFPQYTFFFPLLKKDRDADGGWLYLLFRDHGLDEGGIEGTPGPSPNRILSEVRGLRDGCVPNAPNCLYVFFVWPVRDGEPTGPPFKFPFHARCLF